MKVTSFAAPGLITVMSLLAIPAAAQEIRVLASTVSQPAVTDIAAMYERTTNRKLVLQFDNNPIVKEHIEAGAQFDVVIIEPGMLDDLTKEGKVTAGTRTDVAQVGMALVVRTGTPKRDISTVDAFTRTLRLAKSIGYVSTGFSGTVFLRTLEGLHLTNELRPKLKPTVVTCEIGVAEGELEICAIPATTPPHNVEVLGRFPAAIQTYIGISAGVGAQAKALQDAKSFIGFLASSQAAAVFKAKGFQWIPTR